MGIEKGFCEDLYLDRWFDDRKEEYIVNSGSFQGKNLLDCTKGK